jgi:alkylhydroperoxidase family enzyme
MPDEDSKRALHRALVDRVVDGEGRAPRELRARAFRAAELPAAVQELVRKVAAPPAEVTDEDVATAKAAGFTEDQLFELVVAAAVGRSARRYDAGLAALDEATATREAG